MSPRTRAALLLVLVGFAWPETARATFIIQQHDVRADWAASDFIGWVRVAEVLADPTPARAQARVRLAVIDRLKGAREANLTLVYDDAYVAPGDEDQVVIFGTEQRWRADVGGEFLVFLKRRADGNYETQYGHYHRIVDGWLMGIPREYRIHLELPWNPHIEEFLAKYRASEPQAAVQAGNPRLGSTLRVGGDRVDTPGRAVEQFIAALVANRRREAEQMLHRTRAYGTPLCITSPDPVYRDEIGRLVVTGEAVLGHRALVEVRDQRVGGEPEIWFLIRKGKRWRLFSPRPLNQEEEDELAKMPREGDFRRLTETWNRLRPAGDNRDP